MKDRYLFRAKDSESARLRVGNLVYSADAEDKYKAIIIPVVNSNMFTDTNEDRLGFERWYLVDESTICQCTGLKDMNDNLIFEGDIVYLIYDGEQFKRVIVFDESELDFKGTNGKDEYKNNFNYLTCCEEIEVIGNIYDNPELVPEIIQEDE